MVKRGFDYWIMVFPPIHWFQGLGGKRRLSDIEFLAKKDFDGKIRSVEGFLSAAGDLATLTATSGKDMYLARAGVVFVLNNPTGSVTLDEVVLKMNGTIIETVKFTSHGASKTGTLVYEFKNIGQKVAATQIIKIEVITLDPETDVEGFIEVFEETTGETPVI